MIMIMLIILIVFHLLIYWALSLDNVTVFPLVGQDEPWIAAAPYKLATEGVFGSDLFTGYYGLEQRHYQQLPGFHLMLAVIFRLAGVGVFQMRFLPVALGLLLLPLVFALARQHAGPRRRATGRRAGLLAMTLLLFLRFAGGADVTGIPLLDIARIARYDIGVPVFGLAALWLFNRAEQRAHRPPTPLLYAASGAAVGTAGLFHMYGLFWLLIFLLILLLRNGKRLLRRPAPYYLFAGAVLVWFPWLLYVAAGWQDYLGQQRYLADRFDLLNPQFYFQNLIHEIDRYRVLDLFDETGRMQLARPGLWTAVLGLPLSLLILLRRPLRSNDFSRYLRSPATALFVAILTHLLLFALLLKQKHYNYIIAFWPLAMLALAYCAVQLWQQRAWRPVLALLLLFVMIEGVLGIDRRHTVASQVTPYTQFTSRVADHIPEGSLVLGLQHYWLGLRPYPFRTWLLPLFMTGATLYHESLNLDQALERVDPDVVLIDRHMAQLFTRMADPADRDHARYLDFRRYMARHEATLAGVVEDMDYGRIEVYLLR